MDNQHPIRQSVFETNSSTLSLRSLEGRRVGRPRSAWAPKFLQIALKIAGNISILESMLAKDTVWKDQVKSFCRA